MAIYYSPSSTGFYDTEVMTYPSLPDDCIEITAEDRNRYIKKMNQEQKILVLKDGKLTLEDQPVIITWQSVKDKRNQLLDSSDYTQIPDFPGDRKAWAMYRQQLRDIPQNFESPEDVIWPEKPSK